MKQSDLDGLLGEDELNSQPEKEFDDEIETSDISGLRAAELEKLLHELTARRLVEAMRRGDPGAGMIQAARGFLRDNEITGLDVPGSAQAALRKKLNKDAPFPRIAKEG